MHSGLSSFGVNMQQSTDEIIQEIKGEEYTYTRCSFVSAPAKKADFKKTKIPFIISATVLPLNEHPIKRVESIPRCADCKAYLNTYSEIIPPGYKWRCSICRSINDSPSPLHSYGGSLRIFSPSENTENNKRSSNNPILTESIVEFVSSSEKVTPPPASLVFLIECTKESIERGVFSAVLEEIREALGYLNDPHERATISIILLSSSVELVRIREDDLIVDRVNEIEGYIPMLIEREYTARIAEIKDNLKNKIFQIKEYAETIIREPGSSFGLALKVIEQTASRRAEVFAFLVTQPSLKQGAILKPTTDLEPQNNNFYTNMSLSFSDKNISINIYVLSTMKIEIPYLLPLVRNTGGFVRYYPGYMGNYSQDASALKCDLIQHFSLDNGNNMYCRVRISNETSIKKYWGVSVQNDGLIRMPRIGRGKTFSFEIDYDEDLVLDGLTVQIACIFTNSFGERIVRVINFSVGLGPTAVDLLGMVYAIALKGIESEISHKGSGIKTVLSLGSEAVESVGLQGRMALFPMLIHALIKNRVFLKSASSDLRGVIYMGLIDSPMKVVDAIIYPTLVRLDSIDNLDRSDEIVLPPPMRLSAGVIGSDGTYFLDSGLIAYIFIGDSSPYKVFEGVYGRASVAISPEDKGTKGIRDIMNYIVGGRAADPVTYIVQQDGPPFLLEGMKGMLLDDGVSPVSSSYQEYYSRFISKGYVK